MNAVQQIYKALLKEHGPQGWWPISAGDMVMRIRGRGEKRARSIESEVRNRMNQNLISYHPGDYSYPRNESQRFEICAGAILTQNTSWKQAEKALMGLRKLNALTAETVRKISENKLKKSIRPAGYFNQKAKKLKHFAEFYLSLKGRTPSRDELLNVWGIGRETADSILLYAYNVPVFVVDAYTRRIFSSLGMVKADAKYDEIKDFFERSIIPVKLLQTVPEKQVQIYQEYHALIVEHAKKYYSGGDFGACPLLKIAGINRNQR